MANLAWLLDSNLGMRVACVSFDDGWDFHDSQVSRQAQNLSRCPPRWPPSRPTWRRAAWPTA